MNQIETFKQLAKPDDKQVELFLFGWTDNKGNGGDYGLNTGPASKTLQTLINTTYMFQSAPAFKIQCRPFMMTQAQFDFLQDNDLDTEDFLSTLGPLPEVTFELDLSLYKNAADALQVIAKLAF